MVSKSKVEVEIRIGFSRPTLRKTCVFSSREPAPIEGSNLTVVPTSLLRSRCLAMLTAMGMARMEVLA